MNCHDVAAIPDVPAKSWYVGLPDKWFWGRIHFSVKRIYQDYSAIGIKPFICPSATRHLQE
jgi:hypothetical protein